MAASKFTVERRRQAVELVGGGATLAETAEQIGVRHNTLKGWLTRGRVEKAGDYSDFAKDVAEARDAAVTDARKEMTEDEFKEYVEARVRAGNVGAMKLWWEMHHPKDGGGDDGDGGLGF